MSEQSLREDVDDLRAWVAMQHEAAGLDSSDQAAGEFHAHKRVLGHLHKILAAHPAEPAPVVTDELVEGTTRADYLSTGLDWDKAGKYERVAALARTRRILEAAAPLLGPRPLLNREALTEEIFRATPMQVSRKSSGDAADIALRLARPMPTREQIAKALHEHDMADVWDDEGCNDTLGGVHTSCKDSYLANADAVLALINGGAK